MTGRYVPGTGSVRTHYHLRGKYQPASRYYYCSSPRYSQLSDIERAGEVWDLTPHTRRAHNLQLVSTAESHNPPPHHLSSRLDKTNTLQYKIKNKDMPNKTVAVKKYYLPRLHF